MLLRKYNNVVSICSYVIIVIIIIISILIVLNEILEFNAVQVLVRT